MKSTLRYILLGAVLGVVAFGVSLRIGRNPERGAVWITLPTLQPVFDALRAREIGGRPVAFAPARDGIILSGPRRASAAEDSWLFVRQSATWANGNSNLADGLIVSLKNTGLLGNTGNFQTTTVINGVTYKLKLQTNCAGSVTECQNLASSAYTGNKTFDHRIKFWRASDNLAVLEMLFDDVENPATGDGVLLAYRLGALDPTLSDNSDLIVESYISGGAPSRKQTYSWSEPFWLSGPNAVITTDRGRVILEEMTIGLKGGGLSPGLCVKIVARTNNISLGGICGAGQFYYSVAYGQKTEGNLETTALSGWANGTIAATPLQCGLSLLQHGIFNGGGFVADALTTATLPAGYPESNVAGSYNGVSALYDETDASPVVVGDHHEDLTVGAMNGLSITLPNSDAPGF